MGRVYQVDQWHENQLRYPVGNKSVVALLTLLFIVSWFLSQSLAPSTGDEISRAAIRIASIQQPPERIVIDTNLPTIVLPPTPSADATPDEPPQRVQSYAFAIARNPVADAAKRKPKAEKKQINEVAAKRPAVAPTMLVASSGTATTVSLGRQNCATTKKQVINI